MLLTTFDPTNFSDNVWATNFSDNLSEIYVSYSQNCLVRAYLCFLAILIALLQDKNFDFEDTKTVVIFSETRRQVHHTLLALQCILYIDLNPRWKSADSLLLDVQIDDNLWLLKKGFLVDINILDFWISILKQLYYSIVKHILDLWKSIL